MMPYFPASAQSNMQKDCQELVDRMILYAISYINTPYVWAADGPSAFDCSGYVKYVYAYAGVCLPRNSRLQSKEGEMVPFLSIRKGDLVFFVSNPEREISHVGIAITDSDSDGNFSFIHANHGSGRVSISQFKEPYFQTHYGGSRRIISCE